MRARALENFIDIYGKGTGQLHFSLLNIYLFYIMLSILIHRVLIKNENQSGFVHCSLYKYFWFFIGIFTVYIFIGVGHGIPFWDTLKYDAGVMNFPVVAVLLFVLLNFFKSEKDIDQFMKFFMVCMLVRGFYGIYRFIFMLGDPANPYRNNLGALETRISFFDWGDSLIASVAVFYSIWLLLKHNDTLTLMWRKLHWMIVIVGIFNITFSYRRTAWSGFILVLLWLSQYLKLKQKMLVGIILIIVTGLISSYLLVNRYGEEIKQKGVLERILPDIHSETTGEVTVKEGRFSELYRAWNAIKGKLIFGMGPWMSVETGDILTADNEKILTSHSSIFFILLKMGLVGLTIYFAMLVSYVKFWLKVRKERWNSMKMRAVGETGFAGFVCTIPSIFLAPLVNEYRTMSLVAICLALPYVAYHFDRAKQDAEVF